MRFALYSAPNMQSDFLFPARGLRLVIAVIFAGALISCSKGHLMEPSNEGIFEVNSYRVPCVGVAPMSCLQIRRDGQPEGTWQNFYSEIRGFDYRPGYLYRLRVRATELPPESLPADASSIQYDLVEVIDEMPDPRLEIHDIWALVQIDDQGGDAFNPAAVPEHPYIEFNVTRGAYLGNTGCGEFGGKILRIGPQELRLGPMTSETAQPNCHDGSVTAHWSAALEKVASWHRKELTLALLDGNGSEVLRFRKVD